MVSSALLIKLTFDEQFFSSVPKDLRCTLLLRCIFGTISFLTFAASPMLIPLGIFFVVFNSNIFLVALLSYCLLNDKVSSFESITMLLAFGGIVMIGVSKVEADPLLSDIDIFGLS